MAVYHGIVFMVGVVPRGHDREIAENRKYKYFARHQLDSLCVAYRLNPFQLVQEQTGYGEHTECSRETIGIFQPLIGQRLLSLSLLFKVDRLLRNTLLRGNRPNRRQGRISF